MHFYRVMVAGMVVVIGLCGVVSAQTAETTGTENTAAEPSETEAASASTTAPALNATQLQRLSDLEAKPLHKFSNVELGEYLPLRQAGPAFKDKTPKPADEMVRMARKAIGQPYRLNSVRGDYAESDCVTFVNRAIALSLARDWVSYYKLYERLLHKDGVIDFRNRNFGTMADWLPNNEWILKDITNDLGPTESKPSEPFTYYVRPKLFEDVPGREGKMRTNFLGTDYKSGIKEARNKVYIPREKLKDVLKDLKSGDVFLVIRDIPQNPGCDHLGLIVVDDKGVVNILHSAHPIVAQESLMEALSRWPWVKGFMFLRLRDDARTVVDAELTRLGDSIKTLTPAEQDKKIEELRASRAAAK